MGGACGDRVKTIKTIFFAEKFNFFGKKVFSGERFRIKGLFYTSCNIAISVQKPHFEGEHFPLTIVNRVFGMVQLSCLLFSTTTVFGTLHRIAFIIAFLMWAVCIGNYLAPLLLVVMFVPACQCQRGDGAMDYFGLRFSSDYGFAIAPAFC